MSGKYRGLEDQIYDIELANEMERMFEKGGGVELRNYIISERKRNDEFILNILEWLLLAESGTHLALSKWVLENETCFSSDQKFLDFCIRLSVFNWRTDGITVFLKLGANPNQEILPGRFIYDVCLNRTQHFYNSNYPTELDEAITAITEYGGVSYLEYNYRDRIPNISRLRDISMHDSWCEIFLEKISIFDVGIQNNYINFMLLMLNKSSKPSKKWISNCLEVIDGLGSKKVLDLITVILKYSMEPRLTLVYGDMEGLPHYRSSDSVKESFDLYKITNSSSFILKNIVRICSHLDYQVDSSLLEDFCENMYTKHFLLGIRNMKVADTCFEEILKNNDGVLKFKELINRSNNPLAVKKMKVLFEKYQK